MITYDQLRELALDAKRQLGLKRPADSRIRVGETFSYKICGRQAFNICHVHSHRGYTHFGKVCVNPKALGLSVEDWRAIMIHEMIHFKIHRHGKKFWALQNQHVQMWNWNDIFNRGKALIKSK